MLQGFDSLRSYNLKSLLFKLYTLCVSTYIMLFTLIINLIVIYVKILISPPSIFLLKIRQSPVIKYGGPTTT